jgi:hypothetical protein
MSSNESRYCAGFLSIASERPANKRQGHQADCMRSMTGTVHASLFFFSCALMGPWKNVLRTENMRKWSPGARVGHAWLKMEVMNGMRISCALVSSGRGIGMGRLGLDVAEVGSGGRERDGPVTPGIWIAISFSIALAFFGDIVRRDCE